MQHQGSSPPHGEVKKKVGRQGGLESEMISFPKKVYREQGIGKPFGGEDVRGGEDAGKAIIC